MGLEDGYEYQALRGHGLTGFWESLAWHAKASVDWCELNYHLSMYISEFWNTISSFSMVLMGLFGMYVHRHALETRYHLAYFMIAIVGLGSVAFHATLHRHCQMLDEVPMLWSAAITIFIILENESPAGRHAVGNWLPISLFTFCFITTWLNIFSDGDLQFYLFHFTFGPSEMYCLYRIYRLSRESEDAALRQLTNRGLLCYVAALLWWALDIGFCDLFYVEWGMPNLQLHAWWHVFASLGLSYLTTALGYRRLTVLSADGKTRPQVRWVLGLPALSLPSHAQ